MPEAADHHEPDPEPSGAGGGAGSERVSRAAEPTHDESDGAGEAGPPAETTEAAEEVEAVEEAAHPTMLRRVARLCLAVAGVLVAYYAMPVGELPSSRDLVVASGGLLFGLAALTYVAVRELRILAATSLGAPGVRLDVIGFVVVIVIPLFALAYYAVEQGDASQFAEMETKTDSLYFTLSTLATVGFGDVHAEGQLARGLVSIQIVFDLVFVAVLVSVLGSEIRARAAERRPSGRA